MQGHYVITITQYLVPCAFDDLLWILKVYKENINFKIAVKYGKSFSVPNSHKHKQANY